MVLVVVLFPVSVLVMVSAPVFPPGRDLNPSPNPGPGPNLCPVAILARNKQCSTFVLTGYYKFMIFLFVGDGCDTEWRKAVTNTCPLVNALMQQRFNFLFRVETLNS